MSKTQEIGVYILAAGRQTRYEDKNSKMMADVDGRPAIELLVSTLLTSFSPEQIAVVTSTLFPDLNNFLNENYPTSRLVYDTDPGESTAQSLAKTLPWNTEMSFVTEGDIWYEESFVKGVLETHAQTPEAMVVVSATPKVERIPSHRNIQIFPQLEIKPKSDPYDMSGYRNVGAHLFNSRAQDRIATHNGAVIDVIRDMHTEGKSVVPFLYTGAFLHIASVKDIQSWVQHFSKK